VALAARGACDLDLGPQPVDDPGKFAALRRKAVLILAQATVCAALLTVLAWAGAAR
jgi:hypothetical protein